MTITQLEYIVAVDTYKSFGHAADKCFITQPTLSMQIQKLEEQLDVLLFDRQKKPIETTEIGISVIAQAREVLKEHARITEIIKDKKGILGGNFHIGIIPTIAPYLVPLFLLNFIEKYPDVTITISELTTAQILEQLKNGIIDCGILATPTRDAHLIETPIYWEPLVAFVSKKHPLSKQSTVMMEDINISDVWLLNEGHCFRNQIINLCHDLQKHIADTRLNYQTGSIETLKKIVEAGKGITLLPELSISDFSVKQTNMVRYFRNPEPVREIGLIVSKSFVKKRMLEALKNEILDVIPKKMKDSSKKLILDIDIKKTE
ncbi:MAG: LysR substrate-binding domain-containing protein [Bacteroidales bacterium]|nr:LysR substrate-binding domain-containing protein [Bacteroidales bacterium]MDY0216943.1 LysR substrate-binding domain-containing protein [Bacteroidales bacterium]